MLTFCFLTFSLSLTGVLQIAFKLLSWNQFGISACNAWNTFQVFPTTCLVVCVGVFLNIVSLALSLSLSLHAAIATIYIWMWFLVRMFVVFEFTFSLSASELFLSFFWWADLGSAFFRLPKIWLLSALNFLKICETIFFFFFSSSLFVLSVLQHWQPIENR